MARVLLVYDDYTELMQTESNLRKVGFDAVGISNEYTFADQLLSLNPEVVVVSGLSQKVSSLNIGRKLKENTRWQGKSILIFPTSVKPSAADILKVRADIFLESPVPIHSLVTVMCELLNLDPAPYIERIVRSQESEEQGGGPTSPLSFGKGGAAKESVFVRGAGEGGSQQNVKSESDSDSLFSDVDLSNLEQELLGNKPVDVSGEVMPREIAKKLQEVGSDISSDTLTSLGEVPAEEQLLEIELERIKKEVEDASTLSAEKRNRYTSALAKVKINPQSTVVRVKTRKIQKELLKEWSQEKLKELDELRRQFVKALFKK
ncbi:MAG: hypothetical protein ACLGGX_04045 [Bdellovibrionia bacterium]